VRSRHDESGVTLIELVIVLALMGVVSAMVYSFLINSTQIAARASNSTAAENNGRLALRSISEDLRSAEQIQTSSSTTACPTGTTFPAAFANCIRFLVPHEASAGATTTTIAPGAPPIACPFSKITYGVRAGVIREDRTDYDASCTPKTVLTGYSVLAGLDTVSPQPLFVFYDSYGDRLGAANAIADFTNAGSIAIQVQLTYQTGAPAISLMTMVALRNNR
jgi:prepilin-type N-terminal cleavage/methylation domain-containing protein